MEELAFFFRLPRSRFSHWTIDRWRRESLPSLPCLLMSVCVSVDVSCSCRGYCSWVSCSECLVHATTSPHVLASWTVLQNQLIHLDALHHHQHQQQQNKFICILCHRVNDWHNKLFPLTHSPPASLILFPSPSAKYLVIVNWTYSPLNYLSSTCPRDWNELFLLQ